MTAATREIAFDRFYTHDELTALLRGYAERHPALAALASIGQSHEGRDIWCLTITNRATGPHDAKPAQYIDGNMHAGEVTGSAAALYTINELLTKHGKDGEITALVDTRTFYVLPRVNPDGAEKYLTTPYMLRSSVRPYPYEEDLPGLYPEDLDGDGLILQLRVPDPKGEWKVSDQDPRLMLKRAPDETGGEYYRLLTEGLLREYRGGPVTAAPPKWGLDINRNYPGNWISTQGGAGPYPLSEPETRALAAFVGAHPNIGMIQNYHTTGGVLFRMPASRPEAEMMPLRDRALYQRIGELGTEVTGYPCRSVYETYPAIDDRGTRSAAGSFCEWAYEAFGIFGFAPELWDIEGRAGIEGRWQGPWHVKDQTEEEGLKILHWLDENLGGEGFEAWRPFDHPQLGPVEIGGWHTKTVRQNAPPKFLEEECAKIHRFALRQAKLLPRLLLDKVEVEPLGGDLYIVRATIENDGYLPTNLTQKAVNQRVAQPVTVELSGGEILMGDRRQTLGHLEGRAQAAGPSFGMQLVQNEKRAEWLVQGRGPVTLTAKSEKGGTVTRELKVEG
ncbi:MAG TPA: M14 family metallopeptidase [Thermomicrobiales bacterium]|nr:M14 family metallopeptidase [Thermomicrobiales bacterium]